MKLLVNRKIRCFFCGVILTVLLFSSISAVCAGLNLKHAVLYILLSSSGMGIVVSLLFFLFFREQSKMIENAIERIRDYISGKQDTRIVCDEEGEWYQLFQEINSLASILSAHAENESRSRKFMKDIISDISHQLKTPVAALNIYNGIMKEEAEDASVLREFAELSEQELDRMETLIQNLLKIAKLDAGTIIFEKRYEKVSEIMENLERHFVHQAEKERKTLFFSGDDTAALLCDPNWMEEAVGNIVKNAFNHTREGDSIRSRTFAGKGYHRISQRDR